MLFRLHGHLGYINNIHNLIREPKRRVAVGM